MKSKSRRNDTAFKAKCWDAMKIHLSALGREHMIGVIERGVELNEERTQTQNDGLDS